MIFDYDATEDDELTLHVGDIVTNIDQADGGWWTGELNGKEGLFPENFVEVIPSTGEYIFYKDIVKNVTK